MLDSPLRRSLLALTEDCNEASMEKQFALTEQLLENEDMRRDLTASIKAGIGKIFFSNKLIA